MQKYEEKTHELAIQEELAKAITKPSGEISLKTKNHLVAPKAKNAEYEEKTHELAIQEELAKAISKPSGEISLKTKNHLVRLKSHYKAVQKGQWLGKHPTGEDVFLRLLTKRRGFEKTTGKNAREQIKPTSSKSPLERLKSNQETLQRDHWLGKNPREEVLFFRLLTKRRGFATTTGNPEGEQGKLASVTVAEKWRKWAGGLVPLKEKRWLQVAPKAKNAEYEEKTHELAIQEELAKEISKPSGEISLKTKNHLERLKSHYKAVQKGGLVPLKEKRWLQVAPKAKNAEYEEKTHELAIQEELAKEISKPSGEISLKTKNHLERLKSHYKAVQKGQWLGKHPTGEDVFLRLLTKRRGFAKTTGKNAREQIKPTSSKSPLERLKSNQETLQRDHWLGKNPREEVLFFRLLTKRRGFATTTGNPEGEQGKLASVTVAEKWRKWAGGLVPLKEKRWLQVAPKAKNAEYEEKTHELAIQEELAKEISKPSGEISLKTKNHLERLKSHYKAVQKGQWLGKHPTGEDVFLRLLTKRRGFAKTTGKNAREQIKPTSSKSPLERLKSNQETLQRDHWLGKNPREEVLFFRLLTKRRGFATTTGNPEGEQGKLASVTVAEKWRKWAGGLVPLKEKRWPQVAPKAKNAEYEEKTHELAIQEELAKEISKPSGEISLKTKNHLERLKSHYKAVQKGQWLGKHPTGEDVFLRLLTKRRGFAKTTGKNAREQMKPTSRGLVPLKEKRWLQVASKAKNAEYEEKTHELAIQEELAKEISKPSGEISLKTKNHLERLKSHYKAVQKGGLVPLKEKRWLQVAPKAKNAEYEEKTHELAIQEELAKEISKPSGEISLKTKNHLERLKSHYKAVQKGQWLGKHPTGEDVFLRLLTKRRGFAKTTGKNAREQIKPTSSKSPLERLKSNQETLQRDHWLGKNPREEVLFFRLLTKRRGFATTTGNPEGEQGKLASVTVAEKWRKWAGGLVPLKEKRWLQVAPKAKNAEYEEKTHELAIQEELAKEISKPSGEISLKTKNHLERLKSHYKAVQKGQWLGKHPTGEDVFLRLLTKRRGFAKTTGKNAREQIKPTSSKSPLERLKSNQETLQRDHWLGKNPREEVLFFRLLTKRRGFATTTGNPEGEQGKLASVTVAEKWRKWAGGLVPLKEKRWPQVAPKAKNAEYEEKTHELAIQEELAKEISKPSGEISLKTKNHLERLKSHYKAVQKGQWLGKHPTGEDVFLRLLTKRRGFAKTTGKNAREQMKPTSNQVKPTSHTMGEEIGKPQQVSSLNRLHRAPGHSLQKRFILHLPTELPPLTSSIVVEDSDKDWAGKVVFVLKSTNRSARPSHVKHIIITEQAKKENTPSEQNTEKVIKKEVESEESRKENPLSHLITGGSNSQIPTDELSPDIILFNETHWEHHEQTTSVPPSFDFLSTTNNFLLQHYDFESEWQKKLATIFPDEVSKNIIAQFMRFIKTRCNKLPIQICPEFIATVDHTMREIIKSAEIERLSALRKFYLLPAKKVNHIPTASSRKMEKPSDEVKVT
ncbi:hypothetical protein Chor_008871 [Crotalus horridus]